jgi:RNA polymerase primary sigma factor
MTNEELVTEIQGGRAERLERLWFQVERFIRLQAARYCTALGLASMQEDLYQSGYLALYGAVQTYDQSAGAGFLTWLSLYLKTAFREALGVRSTRQQNDPIHRAFSLDAPASAEDTDGTLWDTIPGESPWECVEERIWNSQARALLDSALQELPPLQSEILRRKYYGRQTYGTMATQLGVDISKLRMEERKAIWTLRHGRYAASPRALVGDTSPSCYHRVGAEQFRRTGESAVEVTVFQRERLAAAQ